MQASVKGSRGEWWRKIPHPTYGNWGGRLKTDPDWTDDYSPEPFDKMDALFEDHDINLRQIELADLDEYEGKIARIEADVVLGQGLQEDLRPYLYPNRFLGQFYGPAYHSASKIIFKK